MTNENDARPYNLSINIHSEATFGTPVHLNSVNKLLLSPSMHLDMQMWSRQLADVQSWQQNGEEKDLSEFLPAMVGATQADLSMSETADLLGFSPTTTSRVYRGSSKKKKKISSERRLCRC